MLFFDAIDTDNDGVISSKEFGVLLQSYGIDPTVAPEAFDGGLDKNKDGIISRSEFMEAGTQTTVKGLMRSRKVVTFLD